MVQKAESYRILQETVVPTKAINATHNSEYIIGWKKRQE
jgi:hypothetical protein